MRLASKKPKLRDSIELREEPEFGGLASQIGTGKIFKTNRSGFLIIRLCDGTHTISQIARHVSETFRIAEITALKDVKTFVANLERLRLVDN